MFIHTIGWWGSTAVVGGSTPLTATYAVNDEGTRLEATMSVPCDTGSTPAAGDFTLSNTHASLGTPAWQSTTLLWIPFASDSRATIFETMTLSYVPGVNPIRDLNSNNLAGFAGASVSNGSLFLQSAALVMSFHRASSFALSGSTVTSIVNEATGTVHSTTGSPQYAATGLNGRPSMDFDGVDDRIVGTDSAIRNCNLGQAARHIFWAGQYDIADANMAAFSVGNPSVTDNGRTAYGISTSGTGTSEVRGTNDSGTGVSISGVISTVDTSPHIQEFFGSSTMTHRRDGVINGVTPGSDLNARSWNPGTQTASSWVIGSYPSALGFQRFMDGDMSYLLVFPSVLTTGINDPVNIRAYMRFLTGLSGS